MKTLAVIAWLLLSTQFSFAQDTELRDEDFSMISKAKVVVVAYGMDYDKAIDLARRTGKIILVSKGVDKEKAANDARQNGYIYVNADGDSRFFNGISKIKFVDGKAMYIQLPYTQEVREHIMRISRPVQQSQPVVIRQQPPRIMMGGGSCVG
jgi:hypothetical protein